MSAATGMSMTEFLRFLSGYCKEMIDSQSPTKDQKETYAEIDKMIRSYQQDYKAAKALTYKVEEQMMEAIETDRRKGFDTPHELIRHVCRIASKPPFFDSEAVSLAAIRGFTTDYLHNHEEK